MFNFLKKKEEPAKGTAGSFQNSFSLEQRAAMLASLVRMAKSDGQAHPKELQLIEQARKLLGVKIDDPTFAQFLKSRKELVLEVLNSLAKDQKTWFISALHRVILADGKIEEEETNLMKGFCEEIGISEYDYLVIVHQ